MSDDKMKEVGLIDEEESGKEGDYELSDSFGMLLRHYRELRNFTLKELEDISGVSAAYILRLERSERKSPSLYTRK